MAATAAVSLIAVSAASAATVVVTPANTHGWYSDDTRPGGAIEYVVDASAPGKGALQLTTDATATSKAQYMHDTATPLADVTELGYQSKQNSASFAEGDPSYQLAVCLGGISGTTCNGFSTFVYEPYENGVVTTGVWQPWDVDAGQMWSSRSYTDGGTCTVVAGAGGPPFYTLSGLRTACPNAVVTKFGVNIGSNNPSYDVEADLVDFNGTTYDFEPYAVAGDKGDCKDGGWKDVARNNGSSFKNQGDCIQYVNTGK
jgi:hypothetical protein